MPKFTRLRATHGADEVNVGTERYPVERSGEVSVPAEEAGRLMEVGGFIRTEPGEIEVPSGFVPVRHAEAKSCSWGGDVFEARDDGLILVPCAAVMDLLSHGFEGVPHEIVEDAKPDTGVAGVKLRIPPKGE